MLSLVACSLAYQAPLLSAPRPALSRSSVVTASVFDDGMTQFKADFPWLAKYGFGPSVKAERWNGRHAMFGWLVIISTAEAQKWGLFPDAAATTALTYKSWGALAQLGFGNYISNERAIIMIGPPLLLRRTTTAQRIQRRLAARLPPPQPSPPPVMASARPPPTLSPRCSRACDRPLPSAQPTSTLSSSAWPPLSALACSVTR